MTMANMKAKGVELRIEKRTHDRTTAGAEQKGGRRRQEMERETGPGEGIGVPIAQSVSRSAQGAPLPTLEKVQP